METPLGILSTLARRYAFREVAALVADRVDDSLTLVAAARVQQLCAFGQRLLDLDAEDFNLADAAPGATTENAIAAQVHGALVPRPLVTRASACRMPQDPREPSRGALRSLVPAYRLLLEVIEVRWHRREMASVVAVAHICGEYLPLLAWQRTLGHAGDPARMAAAVDGPGSRWGDNFTHECPHTRPQRAAAARVLHVAHEAASGWRAYLDRLHSHTSHALGVCAADCATPCSVITRLDVTDRERLSDACTAAARYADSALVRLRHAAPVGHGFGVPSPAEVQVAWQRSREHIGSHEPAVLTEDGHALAGLPSLFGAIAGVPVTSDRLVADVAEAIISALSTTDS